MEENTTLWLVREYWDDNKIKSRLVCAKCNYTNSEAYDGWKYCPMCGRRVVHRQEAEKQEEKQYRKYRELQESEEA